VYRGGVKLPLMGQPYEEADDDLFDAADFQEHADGQQAGGGGAFSASSQEAVVVGYVAGNKLRAALRWFLGFASVDTTEPPDTAESGGGESSGTAAYLLRREPPARHPIWPQLYCHSVAYVGQGLDTTANTAIAVEGPFTDYLGEALRFTPYAKYLLTIRYKSFGRMRFYSDEEMDEYPEPRYAWEWTRWTDITLGPAVQALTADGSSSLTFNEGDPDGIAFPAPIAELMAKSNLTITWRGVPHEWLSDNDNYLYPVKILDRLGRWNDADFLGLAEGCVLFLAAQFDTILYPVAPADPAYPLGGYDVTLSFEHFDPERGVPESEFRGHRLFPYRVDGKWYHAVRETGEDLLPSTEMYKLFQHWADES
jgi:hypothetical protein